MKKKIIFVHKEFVIDYPSKEDAKKDIRKMKDSGKNIYVWDEGWSGNDTFGDGKPCYTVTIRVQCSEKYPTGW